MWKKKPRLKISNVEWIRLEIYPSEEDNDQASIKFMLKYAKDACSNRKEESDDDTVNFTLLALDCEDFAVLEVDFYDYHVPRDNKRHAITQRFYCPSDIFDMIDSWVVK